MKHSLSMIKCVENVRTVYFQSGQSALAAAVIDIVSTNHLKQPDLVMHVTTFLALKRSSRIHVDIEYEFFYYTARIKPVFRCIENMPDGIQLQVIIYRSSQTHQN